VAGHAVKSAACQRATCQRYLPAGRLHHFPIFKPVSLIPSSIIFPRLLELPSTSPRVLLPGDPPRPHRGASPRLQISGRRRAVPLRRHSAAGASIPRRCGGQRRSSSSSPSRSPPSQQQQRSGFPLPPYFNLLSSRSEERRIPWIACGAAVRLG
jgi:hypothetical protein